MVVMVGGGDSCGAVGGGDDGGSAVGCDDGGGGDDGSDGGMDGVVERVGKFQCLPNGGSIPLQTWPKTCRLPNTTMGPFFQTEVALPALILSS